MVAQCKSNGATTAQGDGSHSEEDEGTAPLFLMITGVVFLSILFEKAKHFVEHKARESRMEAIFNQLFGELTVMGFIGLCIFVLGHVTGWLPHSHVELLEEVHMIVFVVAVIFLLFVCAIVVFAVKMQQMWRRFEVHAGATVDGKVAIIDQYAAAMQKLDESWWTRWSPWRQQTLYEMQLQLEFHGLRDAFLNKDIPTKRPGISDHECISVSKKLVPQFNFSEYLSKILVSSIEGIVAVQTSTWFMLWVLFTPLYILQDILDHSKEETDHDGTKVSIWIVVCVVPYALLSALLKILMKIRSIKQQLVPLFHSNALKLAGIETPVGAAEKLPLLQGAPQWWGVKPQQEGPLPRTQPKAKRTSKPGMQALDEETCDLIEQHVKSQSNSGPDTIPFLSSPTPEAPKHAWLRWFIGLGGRHGVGNKGEVWAPSAHENLFWFGRHGVPFLMSAIQTIMMGFAVYAAVLLTVIIPAVLSDQPNDASNHTSNASHQLVGSSSAEDQSVDYGFVGFEKAFLLVVGLLPLTVLLPIFKHVIVGFAMVSHVGMMREPHAVAQVFRDGRTRNSLRILKLLSSMNMSAGAAPKKTRKPHGRGSVVTLSGDELHNIHDADGGHPQQVSRAVYQKETAMELAAKAAFRILDEDNSGSIAPVELRHLLTRLGMAVSDEELELIVEELDGDHDGSIDEGEFMDWVRSKSKRQELDLTDPNAVEQFTARVFAMVDRDGDGSVTTEELYDTLSILIPDIDASEVREIFTDMDEDRNGSVSREEFAATIKGHAAYI